ncbi:MAG: polyphosphate polymerase domain-containing protein [Oscillospiraceae bacterium]|nr:polyphosphate polymerase domain-containing protein [Oscillospiraceae bacterium]
MKTSPGFEVLNERWRHEIKYAIEPLKAARLNAALTPLLRVDSHAGEDGRYFVKSLYFDTPAFGDYADKELGADRRRKLRLRSYGASHVYRLELKSKEGLMNSKLAVSLTLEEAKLLSKGDLSPLRSRDGAASYLYTLMASRAYRPALVIKYERRALLAPGGDFRLTIDTDLKYSRDPASLFCEAAFDIPLPCCVAEIKYGDFLPLWVSREIKKSGLAGSEFGKYSLACESAYGYLL